MVNWNKKHLQAFTTNYSKAPYFKDYMGPLEDIFTKEWDLLSELNIGLLERLRKFLNLNDKPAVRASSLDLRDDPTDRLIDICKLLGADAYLAGQDGATYMDLERFKDNGIAVVTQEFKHPVYPQPFGEFQSHMSVVDLLFNCGPESIKIIETANPS
jgi:hypothetical protein